MPMGVHRIHQRILGDRQVCGCIRKLDKDETQTGAQASVFHKCMSRARRAALTDEAHSRHVPSKSAASV